MNQLYNIRLELEWNEGGVYTVTSPDVPGLVTEGSTATEIQHNVQEALEGLLLAWEELGKAIPESLRRCQVNMPHENQVSLLVAA